MATAELPAGGGTDRGLHPAAGAPARVFFTDAEHERVRHALGGLAAVDWFKGHAVVRLTAPQVAALKAQGLQVASDAADGAPAGTVLQEQALVPPSHGPRASKRTDPRLKARFEKLLGALDTADGAGAFRFRLDGCLTEQRESALRDNGIHILNFRGGYYQAILGRAQESSLRSLPFVAEVRAYDLLDSVSTDLLAALVERDRRLAEGQAVQARGCFDALPHLGDFAEALAKDLAMLSPAIRVQSCSPSAVRFSMPFDDGLIARAASLLQVRQLTVFTGAELASDRVRSLVGAEHVSQPLAGGAGLTGAGETVAVLDSGIDVQHPDFGGPPGTEGSRIARLIVLDGCSATDVNGHGTHVAGIVAGSGAASQGAVRGVAPGASLVVVSMVREDDRRTLALPSGELSQLLQQAVEAGASIVNCSWVRPLGSVYDAACASFDAYLRNHPDVLVVVAAGNQGRAGAHGRNFWAVGSPATAKNVLTVGACGSDRDGHPATWSSYDEARFSGAAGAARMAPAADDVAMLSSAGPTEAGGVKPDLLAPGTYVLAPAIAAPAGFLRHEPCAEHGGRYMYLHGTSMAAPAVVGAAALLREHLRQRLGLARPSAALLKALLITATKPVPPCVRTAPPPIGYPDFDQGFGRLDLSLVLPWDGAPVGRTLGLVDLANDAPDALRSGVPLGDPGFSLHRYEFTLGAAACPLVVTLCWTDAAGSGVQNDLQLGLVLADGEQRLGNGGHRFRLDFAPPDPESRVPMDRHNNVEQIRVDAAPAGLCVLRVWARNTVAPRQGYALVVCGALEGTLRRAD